MTKKKLLFPLVALFFFTCSSRYTRMVKQLFFYPIPKVIQEQKMASSQKVQKIVKQINQSSTIMATGGIIPAIMAPGKKIYQFVEITPQNISFDYLLLERAFPGDLNPLNLEEVKEIELSCLHKASEIPYQDHFFILMKGPFDDSCLKLKEKWPNGSRLLPGGQTVNTHD